MLVTITATCPRCHHATPLGVSQGDGEGSSFSTTACRVCHARFVTLTQQDGTIVLFDFESFDPANPSALKPTAVIEPPAGKSGYHVKPPENLGILERGHPVPPPVGISDEDLEHNVSDLSRILYKPDGTPRSPKEAAKHVGWRAVWVSQLNEAVRTRLAAPPPLSFPPFIFISYRWGTPAENEWVASLAGELKQRGYPVVFDRDEPCEVDVPQLVSKVADCRYFLAILDPGYIERIGRGEANERTKDGWVFDEYNTAAHLSHGKQVRVLGLLRSGDQLPSGFRLPLPGTPGNVIDMRDPSKLWLVLDDVFPRIDHAPDEETAQHARALLLASHEHVCAGDLEQAFHAAQELAELLPGVIDGPAQEIRVALRAGWAERGLAASHEALALAPDSTELHYVTGIFANAAGDHHQAARYLGLYLEATEDQKGRHAAAAHEALGSSLDDLDQVYAGLAHVQLARHLGGDEPSRLNTLGYVLRRVRKPVLAIEAFRAGVQFDPTNASLLINLAASSIEAGRLHDARSVLAQLEALYPALQQTAGLRDVLTKLEDGGRDGQQVLLMPAPPVPDPEQVLECSSCAAWIPLEEKDMLCGRCGSVLSAAGPCPSCTSDGRVIVIPGVGALCPYCRSGQLRVDKQIDASP